jgi:arylsulfatase A
MHIMHKASVNQILTALVTLLVFTAWPVSAAQPMPPKRPPNIIVILADDMGVDSVGAYGSEIATPNLDKLAQTGLRVENAHAMPLCTPSRVRLLTGKDSSRNYKDFGHLDEAERTFAHAARDQGYATFVGGKWQLSKAWEATIPLTGSSPVAAGFQNYIVHNLTEQEVGSRYWGPTFYRNGRRERIEDREYGPVIINQAALDFIDANKAKPFLMFYSMLEPHDPWVLTPDMTNPADKQERYRGMVRHLDRLVGTAMKKIEDLGLSENTLIIFTSDNGTHPAITVRQNGVLVQGGKGTTTLRGTQVPFIANWRGTIPPGMVSSSLVDIADIAPTLADLVGKPLSGEIDGKSLWPLFLDPRAQIRRVIAHTYIPTGRTPPTIYAFNRDYKLYVDGRMFDLDADPLEAQPLAPTSDNPRVQAARIELKAALDALPRPVPFR